MISCFDCGVVAAVLMLGYEEQMRKMLREQNPGLQRRFSLESAYRFEDFSDAELELILRAAAQRDGLELPRKVRRVALTLLVRERIKPNFGCVVSALSHPGRTPRLVFRSTTTALGSCCQLYCFVFSACGSNAGTVETLLGRAKARLAKRVGTSSMSTELTVADLGVEEEEVGKGGMKLAEVRLNQHKRHAHPRCAHESIRTHARSTDDDSRFRCPRAMRSLLRDGVRT